MSFNKICQRCKAAYVCKVDDISNCQCSNVSLSSNTQAFISTTKWDCLCKDCLRHLDLLVASSKMPSYTGSQDALIENLHYYIEDGKWVFTELYHLMRGYCCGNGCRHCVYGVQDS